MRKITRQIDADLTAAMKAREQETLDALRMVRAALQNEHIALGHDLADEEVTQVLRRLLKQRREAAGQYQAGGRTEAAAHEEREAKLIEAYLPNQLDDDALKSLIDQTIQATGATGQADFGKVMSRVMGQLGGRADGARVTELVRQHLE